MRNVFIDTMALQTDEKKYQEFKKKNGKLTYLNEELLDVGPMSFVPFFNTACLRIGCIYDLSHLAEIYERSYDPSDAFRPKGTFTCHYCEEELEYGNFYTSQELFDEVNGLFQMLVDKTQAKLFSMAKLPPAVPTENTPVKPYKERIASQGIASQQSMAKLTPSNKRRETRIKSTLFDWDEIKFRLKTKKIPSFDDFSKKKTLSLKKSLMNFGSMYQETPKREFVFGDEIKENLPTVDQMQIALQSSNYSIVLQQVIMMYWRSLYCKLTGKVLSVWLYKVDSDSKGRISCSNCEDITRDGKIILHDLESSEATFVFKNKDKYYILEYTRSEQKLSYYNFDSDVESDEVEEVSEKVYEYFKAVNHQFLNDGLGVRSKDVVQLPLKDEEIGSALSYYLMKKYFDVLSDDAKNDPRTVTEWIFLKIGLVRQTRDIPVSEELESSASDEEGPAGTSILEHSKKPFAPGVSKFKPISRHQSEDNILEEKSQKTSPKDDTSIKRDVRTLPKKSLIEIDRIQNQKQRHSLSKITEANEAQLQPTGSRRGSQKRVPISIKPSVAPKNIQEPTEPKKEAPRALPPVKSKSPTRKSIIINRPNSRSKRLSRSVEVNSTKDTSPVASQEPQRQEINSEQELRNLLWLYYRHDKQKYKDTIMRLASSIDPVAIYHSSLSPGRTSHGNNSAFPFLNEPKYDSPVRERSSDHRKSLTMDLPSLYNEERAKKANLKRLESISSPKSQKRILPKIDPKLIKPQEPVDEELFNKALQIFAGIIQQEIISRTRNLNDTCLIFKTNFFKDLITDRSGEQFKVSYSKAAKYTDQFTGKGNTILDCYSIILIPIAEKEDNELVYRAIAIDTKNKKICFFSPTSTKQEASQYCRAVVLFLRKEMKVRAEEDLNVREYTSFLAGSPQINKLCDSAHWTLAYLLEASKGHLIGCPSTNTLIKFIQTLNKALSTTS
jgi:hypothetical protein